MTLAMPKTQALQTQLEDFLNNHSGLDGNKDIWVGLSDRKKENVFLWEDGTPLTSSWNYWAQGDQPGQQQPNNFKNQDCVSLWVKGRSSTEADYMKWKDDACKDMSAFVCERDT